MAAGTPRLGRQRSRCPRAPSSGLRNTLDGLFDGVYLHTEKPVGETRRTRKRVEARQGTLYGVCQVGRRPTLASRKEQDVRSLIVGMVLGMGMLLTGAMAAVQLAEYLRFGGTQLDLRGLPVTDADLAALSGPAFQKVETILLARTNITHSGLIYLRHLPVRELDLYYTNVTDPGLSYLEGLPLRQLNLSGTAVSDAGLRSLRGLLEGLVLRATKVTGKGLAQLSGLPLKRLDLSLDRIGDNDLAQLIGLSKLQSLDLSSTLVTDAGLVHLLALANLSEVSLAGTRVTQNGIDHLKAKRPDLKAGIVMPTR